MRSWQDESDRPREGGALGLGDRYPRSLPNKHLGEKPCPPNC
jgi:hypothetical protein